eukprot:m.69503 g.69503  ORF g.69503 m.69503 type:complete len:452 (+) comp11631_c0_seq8:61-1416(+)
MVVFAFVLFVVVVFGDVVVADGNSSNSGGDGRQQGGHSLQQQKLNVLFLVSDDLRPELGVYGGNAITPNLDKLASDEGAVVFDRAYVQQAICCPSRSSFLTSRRPDTTKVWDLKTYWRQAGGNFTTLPQVFKEQGYWSVGMGKVFHPGFHDDAPYSWSEPYFHAADHGLSENMTHCFYAIPDDYSDEDVTDGMLANHAVATLQKAKEMTTPFFVAVGLHRPHLPWDVPQKYFDMYNVTNITLADHNTPPKNYGDAKQWSWDPQSGPRHCGFMKNASAASPPAIGEYGLVPDWLALKFRHAYYASVSATDRNMGLVLDTLEESGKANSTIVVFIGDHGWQLGDLGEFGKKTNFERATRAPLIIRVPPILEDGNGLSSRWLSRAFICFNASLSYLVGTILKHRVSATVQQRRESCENECPCRVCGHYADSDGSCRSASPSIVPTCLNQHPPLH